MGFDFEKLRGTHLETILELVSTYPVDEAFKCEKTIAIMRELGKKGIGFRHYFYMIKKLAGIQGVNRVNERPKQIRLDYKDLIANGMSKSNAQASLMLKYSISHATVSKAIAGCFKEGDD